ncbi:hypothetical protein AB0O20_14420 [Streptomyces kronopolitis]|uniref:OsmC family protein n=1 Tax=Streptomyces kronopolitis TaxID=1612435 RepID=UPI003431B41E
MTMDASGGGGQIAEVTLRPEVTVADASMAEKAHALHDDVHSVCFIARSVNFPIRHSRAHAFADPLSKRGVPVRIPGPRGRGGRARREVNGRPRHCLRTPPRAR